MSQKHPPLKFAEVFRLLKPATTENAESLFADLVRFEDALKEHHGGSFKLPVVAAVRQVLDQPRPESVNELIRRIAELAQSNTAAFKNSRAALEKAINHAYSLTRYYQGALANAKRKARGEVLRRRKVKTEDVSCL